MMKSSKRTSDLPHLNKASSILSCCKMGKPLRHSSRTTVPGGGRVVTQAAAIKLGCSVPKS